MVLDKWLLKEYGKCKIRLVDLLFILAIMVLGFFLRKEFIAFKSGDWDGFLYNWCSELSAGGYKALGTPIGNYTCLYMYILAIIVHTKFPWLVAIKSVSIIFDYIAAFVVLRMLLELTQSKSKAILGFAAILCWPTIVFNGAVWAQCDIIYSTFILLSFYTVLKGRDGVGLLMFSIAFAFKLQAIFFLPVLIILCIKGKIKIRFFSLVPIVYILSVLPAWMLGRSFKSLMTIYVDQAGTYKHLSLLYPNIYYLFGETEYSSSFAKVGILLTMAMLGAVAYWLYVKKVEMTGEIVLKMSLFICMAIVYFLPHMHERYGFIVGILSIIYGIHDVKKIYVPILMEVIMVLCYSNYLFLIWNISIYPMVLTMGILLLIVGNDFYQTVQKQQR